MDASEQLIRGYFLRRIADWPAGSPLQEEAVQLSEGIFNPAARDDLPSAMAYEMGFSLEGEELDLILDFVRDSISSGAPLDALSLAVLHLKRYFSVGEGTFLEARPNEVAQIIGDRLDAILADGVVDSSEDLEQVELQSCFDLSYDQYLALGRAAIERAYADLQSGIESHITDTLESRQFKLYLLHPLYVLATAQPRTLGSLY